VKINFCPIIIKKCTLELGEIMKLYAFMGRAKKIYCRYIIGVLTETIGGLSIVRAENDQEAEKKALESYKRKFPEKKGYFGHRVKILEIKKEMFKE
jgi:hypothetical protein